MLGEEEAEEKSSGTGPALRRAEALVFPRLKAATALERVLAKREPVRRPDTRQDKDLEQDGDSKKWHFSLAGTGEVVSFNREELRQIFNLYGRMVCAGEWRDYGIAFTPQKAVFSVYRRACEFALYRIEKTPALARKQGIYSVVAATGLIVKRGHDLSLVIAVLDRRLKLVTG